LAAHLGALPPGSSLFEVGCAPGRWLAYFSKTHGLKTAGIDYSQTGVEKTRENLKLLGVEADVEQADFFHFTPSRTYDAVMSLGFIEHFEDQQDVVRRHLALLKPGGLLVLGVPNFRGIYGPLQRYYNNDVLLKHNLSIMSLEHFRKTAQSFDLDIVYLDYLGGFEPTLFVKPPKPTLAQNVLVRFPLALARRLRAWRLFDSINHPFISSYILCIMRKRKD